GTFIELVDRNGGGTTLSVTNGGGAGANAGTILGLIGSDNGGGSDQVAGDDRFDGAPVAFTFANVDLITTGVVPSISFNGSTENSISFNFGDFTDFYSESARIDILFTVPVSTLPFADGLLLTNLVSASEASTNAGTATDVNLVQFILGQPNVAITKGVLAVDNPGGYFVDELLIP